MTPQRLAWGTDEADRLHNEALTALDRSVSGPAGYSDPSPAFDDQRIADLNQAWNIMPAPPAASGVRGKLADLVWRVVSPYLQRQVTFNSWLVDHLNRNLAAAREAHQAALEDADALRAHSGALAAFQARLIQYAAVTLVTRAIGRQGRAPWSNTAISGPAEGVGKRAESAAARPSESMPVSTRSPPQTNISGRRCVVQQALARAQAEVARRKPRPSRGPRWRRRRQRPDGRSAPALMPANTSPRGRSSGSRDDPYPDGSAPAAQGAGRSTGCGRGEFSSRFLSGVRRGIDLNHEMAHSFAGGLDVTEAMRSHSHVALPDGALGGPFAAQSSSICSPPLLAFLRLAAPRSARRPPRPQTSTQHAGSRSRAYPGHHACGAATWALQFPVVASGSQRRRRVPVSGRGGGQASTGDGDRGRGAGPGRPRRFVQPQRRETERPDVHVPRLRGDRDPLSDSRTGARPEGRAYASAWS